MRLLGNVVKEFKKEELINKVTKMTIKPKLTIIMVGESKASQIYVRNKITFAKEVGIVTNLIHLKENTTEVEMLKIINQENNDDSTNGLFVQFPIPNHINQEKIIEAIAPHKDVDGFTYDNIGKLFIGNDDGLLPCTVAGIIDILDFYKVPIATKNIVIVGRSNIVGKPLALNLINQGATVTVCNSKTKNIKTFIQSADIFISAIGVAKFFTSDYFENKKDLVIIDVGMNRDEDAKLCGDVDCLNVEHNVAAITPVPGGVGVMTVVRVISNVIKATELKNENYK